MPKEADLNGVFSLPITLFNGNAKHLQYKDMCGIRFLVNDLISDNRIIFTDNRGNIIKVFELVKELPRDG